MFTNLKVLQNNELFNNKICEIFNVNTKDEIKYDDNLKKILQNRSKKFLKKKLLEICDDIIKINYSENLVYAGGCALNF